MTDVYLRRNKPAIDQFRSPRRQAPIGVIGLHTSESVMDTVGPDTGAENVAAFIARRTDYGSYHDIGDSDSIVSLVRYTDEAFHIGTHTLNRRTTGLSFACRTSDWAKMSPARRAAFLRNGAKAAARQNAYHASHGKPVPARRITLAQALAGERGFLAHGDADPGVRSPHLFPWDEFLRYYAEAIGVSKPPHASKPPKPTPPKETFLMALTDAQQKALAADARNAAAWSLTALAEIAKVRGATAASHMLDQQAQDYRTKGEGADTVKKVAEILEAVKD